MPRQKKKVFVTGCFDLLHSGHIAFLEEAATHGEVHVGIGSDQTIHALKGRYPICTEEERRYMLEALRAVTRCTINRGSGILDFVDNDDALSADILFVNEDGSSPEKEEYCARHGLQYMISRRLPHETLPVRSTTVLRDECRIPFRIDLAGGWLDQPYVSKYYPGPVLTISIEPTIEFNDRSGMASSTRRKAIELWHTDIPTGDREKLAKLLFSYENPPGTKEISGSQDALGIVLPGLNRFYYDNDYWPQTIETVLDDATLQFVEESLSLVMLNPRKRNFSVLENSCISRKYAQRLSVAAENCWEVIRNRDLVQFGNCFTESFEAQAAMFPNMVNPDVRSVIEKYSKTALGWKVSGAGGGGYVIFITEKPIDGTIRVKIRR
jgi:cytidyltransferase-like protein